MTTGSRSSASTEPRWPLGTDGRDEPDQTEHASREAGQHRARQPAESPSTGARDERVAPATRPDVVEPEGRPGEADEHDDLRGERDGQGGVDEGAEREDPDHDADDDEDQTGRPRIGAETEGVE